LVEIGPGVAKKILYHDESSSCLFHPPWEVPRVAGIMHATYAEAVEAYEMGKQVIECLANSMRR
jgi:hypothetical protein